jgi:hypothetical protein
MSRFGTGFGFNKYNASLWGGGTETFTANVANFDGSTDFTTFSGFCNGATEYFVNGRINLDTIQTDDVLYIDYLNTGGGARVVLQVSSGSASELLFGVRDSDGSSFRTLTTSGLGLTTGTDYAITASIAGNGGMSIRVNGSVVASASVTFTNIYSNATFAYPSRLGAYSTNGADISRQVDGRLWNWCAGSSELTTSALGELESATPKCYEILSDDTKGLIHSFWPLENHAGFTGQEYIDQKGSNDLSNSTGLSFTGTAQIECEA